MLLSWATRRVRFPHGGAASAAVALAAAAGIGGGVAQTAAGTGGKSASAADCAEPICDDKKSMFMSAMSGGLPKANAAPAGASAKAGQANVECPLTRSELGRSTWDLLHTVAAYYPDEPDERQMEAAKGLIASLAVLYACSHCREHLATHVGKHPPDVSSRAAFSMWLCRTHNAVNSVLGKPEFPCSEAALSRRWRTGCRSSGEDETAAESLGQE